MPVVRRLLLAGAATAVAIVVGIVVLGGDETPADEPSSASTPLTSFDTSRVTILRTGFCARVADTAVAEALQGAPSGAASYGNGDRVRLARGVRDRAHEFGCSWSADGSTAAAWVFAPPVTRATAADLLRRAVAARGCERVPDAPAYGDPSAGLVCTTGGSQEVSFRGLFGDAWLVCTLSSDAVSTGQAGNAEIDRAGRWCVAVAQAARVPDASG